MLKIRLLLVAMCAIVIWLIFQLPKVVVENEASEEPQSKDSISSHIESHSQAPKEVMFRIHQLRARFLAGGTPKEKNAIFADSLANLYRQANRIDSAAWFSEEASKFFNTTESLIKAGDDYYQAYTLAIDLQKQKAYATKAQDLYGKVLKDNPTNLEVKTKLAMTYLGTSSPMQGITMLREVLQADPENELALFNLGMLSIQSGQNDKAIDRLERLVKINPGHIQGHLLLGIAKMNLGDKQGAKEQFEKVKQMDKDPAVQATVDSYLKDLNK
jgi:tetratricopeptide (TPR) repeat protein